MTMNFKAFGIAATLVALSAATASGQYTGVSHPDETIITNSPDDSPAPATVAPPPPRATQWSAAPAPLNPRSTVARTAPGPYYTAPAAYPRQQPFDPDGAVVGDSIAPTAQPLWRPVEDFNAGVVVRVPGPSNRLPEGTLVTARLLQSLSTRTTREGTEWTAELTQPLQRDGLILVPAGSLLSGKVTEVRSGKRVTGKAAIYLTTIAVSLPDGSVRGFHAQLIDTSLTHNIKVDKEGTVLHRSHRKEEAGVLGLTAGSGAAAGAILGGVPGALVGAGVGAGVSGVVWLKEDKQAELPRDTQLTFELTRSLGFDDTNRNEFPR